MAKAELVEALADCLEALRQGETELEVCLAQHSRYRQELEALLEIVRLIPRLPAELAPSAEFRERTRRLLVGGSNGSSPPPSSDLGWQGAGSS